MALTPADVHNVAFNKPPLGRRGYNEDEVDAFLDRVEAELIELVTERDSLREKLAAGGTPVAAPPVLTPATRGTTPDDGALRAVTSERDSLKAELAAVKEQLEGLKSEVNSGTGQSDSLRKQHESLVGERDILAARLKQSEGDLQKAQSDLKQAEAALKEAKEKAAEPVNQDPTAPATRLMAMAQEVAERLQADAKSEASKLVGDATKQADMLLIKAREQATTTEHEANRRRIELESKIDQLKAFEREYRTHLRSYLSNQLSQLDEEKQLAGKK